MMQKIIITDAIWAFDQFVKDPDWTTDIFITGIFFLALRRWLIKVNATPETAGMNLSSADNLFPTSWLDRTVFNWPTFLWLTLKPPLIPNQWDHLISSRVFSTHPFCSLAFIPHNVVLERHKTIKMQVLWETHKRIYCCGLSRELDLNLPRRL